MKTIPERKTETPKQAPSASKKKETKKSKKEA